MLRLTKLINRTLSARLSLMIVLAMGILLIASMSVMLYHSRKTVKEEAIQKSSQTLDGAIQRIDNVLLSVEQATGNIYFNLLPHLNNPEAMFNYSRMLVEANPYVAGCAIALEPGFYKDRPNFMAYVHRGDSAGIDYASSKLVTDKYFGHRLYTEQDWYKIPMERGLAEWINPITKEESKLEPIITYSLPIRRDFTSAPVGVIGVDISLSLLSRFVAEAKPSPNSYCALLDQEGSFIVHPDEAKMKGKNALEITDHTAKEVAQAMVSGETGDRVFELDGKDYYIFYKPFKREYIVGRSESDLGWSAGIIYPEDDIFGDYYRLSNIAIAIAFVGLLLLYVFCRFNLHQQLKPLNMLAENAQLIAKGNYDETIPNSHREDEIGRLQNNFQQMQKSLATNIGELDKLTTQLQAHGEDLRTAYQKAQKADRMKTAFLHNMTNQMTTPAEAIVKDVEALRNEGEHDLMALTTDIEAQGHTIATLLDNLIVLSDEEIKKGGGV